MARDSKGAELAHGDLVTVAFKVEHTGPDDSSLCGLKAVDAADSGVYRPYFACHSSLVTRCEPGKQKEETHVGSL